MSRYDGMSAEEYVETRLAEGKEYYKDPDKHIDEMIKLLTGIKENLKDDVDLKWRLVCAVDDAWHVVLWSHKVNYAGRLLNTLKSYVGLPAV